MKLTEKQSKVLSGMARSLVEDLKLPRDTAKNVEKSPWLPLLISVGLVKKPRIFTEDLLPFIEKDALAAALYALNIGKRLPEAEFTISKDPVAAYVYATCVVQHRWSVGEEAIKEIPELWESYERITL